MHLTPVQETLLRQQTDWEAPLYPPIGRILVADDGRFPSLKFKKHWRIGAEKARRQIHAHPDVFSLMMVRLQERKKNILRAANRAGLDVTGEKSLRFHCGYRIRNRGSLYSLARQLGSLAQINGLSRSLSQH